MMTATAAATVAEAQTTKTTDQTFVELPEKEPTTSDAA